MKTMKSAIDERETQAKEIRHGTSTRTERPNNHPFEDSQEDEQRGLDISALMKAFLDKPVFSGSWEENLDNVISIYDTFAAMFVVTAAEKLKTVPVILKGDALTNFLSILPHANHLTTRCLTNEAVTT